MISHNLLASPCHRAGPAVVASHTVPFDAFACPVCGDRFPAADALPRCGWCGNVPHDNDDGPCPACGIRRVDEDTFELPGRFGEGT